MAIELVTGHLGHNHIDAGDVRALLMGIFGLGQYLLYGSANPTIAPAMTVKIPKMELVLAGSHFRTDGTDQLTFAPASQGYYRMDQIVITRTENAGVENAEITILQGTPSTSRESAYPANIVNTATSKTYAIYNVLIYQSECKSITFLPLRTGTIGDRQSIIPISEGGTGVTSKNELLNMLGISGNAGEIVQAISPSGTTSMTDTMWRDMGSTLGLSVDLQPGTWIVKAYLQVKVQESANVGLQIYDTISAGSFGVNEEFSYIDPSMMESFGGYSIPVSVIHFGKFTEMKNFTVRTRVIGTHNNYVSNEVLSGYIRAMRVC